MSLSVDGFQLYLFAIVSSTNTCSDCLRFPYTAIDCGVLTDPSNGAVDTSSGTTFMMTATYTCNDGYMRIGSESRTCGSDRNWTPEAPTCERKLVIIIAGTNITCNI